MADFQNYEDAWLIGLDNVFGRILEMHAHKGAKAGNRAIDSSLLQCRENVTQRHRHWRCTEPLQCRCLEFGGEDSNLLAFKVGKMTDRSFRYDGRRLGHKQPNAMEAFLGAKSKHEF